MEETKMSNFIQDIIDEDLKNGVVTKIHTRFPPEPNGYLHIGHAKAICVDFMLAEQNGGLCNLRFDDTNPSKEDTEYVDSIQEDIKWLGFDWGDRLYYASDYFDRFYEAAVKLIKDGKAYVDNLNAEQMREYRGTLTTPGKESPNRNRPVEENLDLFARMKKGEFAEGEYVLRAKIDMASPNMNMRDPVIYRIIHTGHYRAGEDWCIYPMYDFAHPLEDAFENITHSCCSLEFEDHRPLYDWVVENVGFENPPHQYEFARLNITYTVMSKRKLRELVDLGIVNGWDDPRMPTLSGLRRRGYTPSSIREFCKLVGVAKANSIVDYAVLEHCIRDELNKSGMRAMAIVDPLKITIENYPDGQVEYCEVTNNPECPEMGTRKVPFTKELYIERSDFEEVPPPKYFRLTPEREVRLMGAYFIKCKEIIKNDDGSIKELICIYDPATQGGNAPDGRKVKGTIHWVSATECVDAQINLYDQLFKAIDPDDYPEGEDYKYNLNENSIIVKQGKIEKNLADVKPGDRFQFVRNGYFVADKDSTPDKIVFNRITTLKDTWAKLNN